MRRPLLLIALMLSLGLVSVQPAAGADSIVIVSDEQKNDWPNGVTFTVKVEGPAQINRIRLDYSFGGGFVSSYGNPKFDPSTAVNAEFTLRTGGNNYVPPGAEITYRYLIEDTAGNTLRTDPKKFVYLDTRFKWDKTTEGLVTVYHHDAREANIRAVMRAAQETVENVGQKAGTKLKNPFTVVAYNSIRELDAAIQFSSQASRDTVAGQAHSNYMVVHVAADAAEAVRNTTHEVTHLITREATDNPFVEVPTWLNEGLSTYFQDNQGAEWNDLLRQKIRQNQLLRLKDLNGRPGKVEENFLLYAQGGSAVKFLIEKYGPDKMAELLAAYKAGTQTNDAFKKVYGKDLEGFEAEWRQAIGAQPVGNANPAPVQPTARPNTQPAAPVPTVAPIQSAPATSTDRGSNSVALIAAIAAIGAVLVVGVGGLAMFLRRNRL